jgi:O-antigen ligase
MSFGILAVACLGLKGQWKDLLLRFGLVLALLFFIALAQTRSAYVALVICIALLTVLGHVRYALVLCIFGAICTAAAYMVWDNSFIDLGQRLDGFRFQIWNEAWKGIAAHPFFGHGITTSPSFLPMNKFSSGGWESTHNVYFGHAYIGGIVGLLIFLAMISNMAWICFSRWWRERKEQNVRYMTLLACLVLCFSLTSSLFVFTTYVVNVHIHWLVFWTPFAVLWSMEAQDMERTYA